MDTKAEIEQLRDALIEARNLLRNPVVTGPRAEGWLADRDRWLDEAAALLPLIPAE